MRILVAIALLSAVLAATAQGGELKKPSPERGYELLLNKAYLPPDFDQETFDRLWKLWPEPLRSKAKKATPDERRQMAYARYGLIARPGDPQKRPLQYVVDARGNWTMNCLACHQGQIEGRPIAGLPNAQFALETLTADVRAMKMLMGKPFSNMDLGSLVMPLGTSNGTTNAIMFGVALMNYRDADLNVVPNRPPPKMIHHDHDAPPWWNVHKKERLYIDNVAPKTHRSLMQFLLVRENGPKQFRAWEDDYRHVLAYIESLPAPKFPRPVDQKLAGRGEKVFLQNCATCHGTYGPEGKYPERTVALDIVGTDPVRLTAIPLKDRERFAESWFTDYGKIEADASQPTGYLAPPLDGVWASAPYFHNGAVPTLWHVLHPSERPVVWQQRPDQYDWKRIGLSVAEFDKMPDVDNAAERRTYFDSTQFGKSASGHDFPDALSEKEKQAVLEYLKTL